MMIRTTPPPPKSRRAVGRSCVKKTHLALASPLPRKPLFGSRRSRALPSRSFVHPLITRALSASVQRTSRPRARVSVATCLETTTAFAMPAPRNRTPPQVLADGAWLESGEFVSTCFGDDGFGGGGDARGDAGDGDGARFLWLQARACLLLARRPDTRSRSGVRASGARPRLRLSVFVFVVARPLCGCRVSSRHRV